MLKLPDESAKLKKDDTGIARVLEQASQQHLEKIKDELANKPPIEGPVFL